MTTKKHDDPPSPNGFGEASPTEAAAPKAAEAAPIAQPFPLTASINEPQTVSLPLPQGTVVPKPSITLLDPDSCTIGDADFTLKVSGEHFFSNSVINFAGHDEPTTLNEDGTLSTGINMAVWQGPDVVQVAIKNGPEVSDPADFEFLAAGGTRSTRHKGRR